MHQFLTLAWLKYRLFRNSIRSKKAMANSFATIAGSLFALFMALVVSLGLGMAAYVIAGIGTGKGIPSRNGSIDAFSFLFLILAGIYLMWATVPLSFGGASQFDAGRLLLYPVSLGKIFAADFVSDFSSIGSIFAMPIVLAISLGTGLGRYNVWSSLLGGVAAIIFGLTLSKWVAISVGALTRRNRSRSESLIAVTGVVIGLGGAFAGQWAPMLLENKKLWNGMRWSPAGAAVTAVFGMSSRGNSYEYQLSLLLLVFYSALLLATAFVLARRSALRAGSGAVRIRERAKSEKGNAGWSIPLLSDGTSAVFEKEMRYAFRNPQLRIMAFLPLVLLGLKLAQTTQSGGRTGSGRAFEIISSRFGEFAVGVAPSFGILYIFLLVSALFCNSFAFEGAGMRSLVLSPIRRRSIIVGKNLSVMILALTYAGLLLVLNQLIFRDLSASGILFSALAFVVCVTFFAHAGNWMSVIFPRRVKYGKRLNSAGLTGILLLAMTLGIGVLIMIPVVIGYASDSIAIKYATLFGLAVFGSGVYLALLPAQARALERKERDILAIVGAGDDE